MLVTVHWEDGPSTAAWVELWRRIFEDLAAGEATKTLPTSDAAKDQG